MTTAASPSPPADSPPPRRILVVYNPVAGRSRKKRLSAVLDRATALGCAITLRETTRRGDAEEFARAVDGRDFDLIVAAGGDGTINEVINGLAGRTDGPGLAIIPLGTANVLACEIGLDPQDPDQVAATLAGGPTRAVHMGVANGRHFLLMAGAGLDAQVVEGMAAHAKLKRRTGKFAYVVESLRQAFGYDFPPLEIRANGQRYKGRMAVACKGRHYGGPFIAAPDAKLERPSLEVCILPRKGVSGMIRYGLALPLGKLSRLSEVKVVSTNSIVIVGPRGAPVQADGDIVARLPAEITIADATIDLVMPSRPRLSRRHWSRPVFRHAVRRLPNPNRHQTRAPL